MDANHVEEISGSAPTGSAWKRFWDRGGWWKGVAFTAVYLALYLATGAIVGRVAGDALNTDDMFGDGLSVFLGLALPLLIGATLLFLFAASVGWLPRPLFGKQPVPGAWWMWIAPVLVVIAIVLRIFATPWSGYTTGVIIATFVAGLGVGVAEEVLTRGILITLLRRHGYREWAVAALSSLVFALLHVSNLLSGQPVMTVLATVGFTFGFGMMMYLTLRVTGNLIWPIILHAVTDPTTILATGGIDVVGSRSGDADELLTLTTLVTVVFLGLALVALVVIRGDAAGRAALGERGLVARPGDR